MSIPPNFFLGGLAILIAAGLLVFYNVNIEIFGLGRPPYSRLKIDNTWEHVTLDQHTWSIEYESYRPNTFLGLVRFIGPIRESGLPFLTHDVLVTSGDFADPALVNTSVFDHKFSWYSRSLQYPRGTINLIHAVPQKEEIYEQLLEVKNGQQVRVIGFEVLRINAYSKEGKPVYGWQDAGCNTLMITRIDVLTP